MISFPTCKINLGLNILSRRVDGYHEISSLMYPVPVKDILEIVPAESFEFTISGLEVPGRKEDNLIYKAYELMKEAFNIPPVKIYLYKNIPMGGGLGGGSSNAAFTLKVLNDLFNLNLSSLALKEMAAKLGSDCPFFIDEFPQLAKGRGEILTPHPIRLKGKFLLLVNNGTHINTGEAYGRIQPKTPTLLLENILSSPIELWKEDLINDFEKPTFEAYPQLSVIKNEVYKLGAIYSAMTGSGSTIYGIFNSVPMFEGMFDFPIGFVQYVDL